MSTRSICSRHGFTLVELLVVISIIAVLLACFLPAIGRTREVARRVLCAANLRQIDIAIESYANNNTSYSSNASGGGLFRHQASILQPVQYPYYWNTDSSTYIPPEQRQAHPQAMAYLQAVSNDQPWDQLGGPIGSGAFFPALYPEYINNGKVFDCPSVHNYGWNGLADVFVDYTVFERSMGPYLRGKAVYGEFWCSYVGNIYGRLGRRNPEEFGFGFYSSYFVQGYYPYVDEYRSSVGTLMWDCGNYGAWLGAYAPGRYYGCHNVGGNELFVDGHVKWKTYPWVASNL